MTHGVGTTCWLAPELIKDNTGTETIDVYAFGIVLWELATREEVYHNLSAAQIISRVANERPRPPLPAERPLARRHGGVLGRGNPTPRTGRRSRRSSRRCRASTATRRARRRRRGRGICPRRAAPAHRASGAGPAGAGPGGRRRRAPGGTARPT